MVAIKQRLENSISQPLIGKDYQCCGQSPKVLDFVWICGILQVLLLCYKTSYHDIAVINLSEKAPHYLFLLSNLFTQSHKLVCGCLQASWLITGLYLGTSHDYLSIRLTFQANIWIPKTTICLSLSVHNRFVVLVDSKCQVSITTALK